MLEPRDRCILVIDDSDSVPYDALRRALEPQQELLVARSVDEAANLLPAVLLVLLAVRDVPAAMLALAARAPELPVFPLARGADAVVWLPALTVQARSLRAERERLTLMNRELAANLDLLREDEDAGRRVQQRILPESPRDYGWCVAEHRVIPSLFLSGDFVDHFALAPGHLAFYLADVSGHGMSSAFITVLLKTLGNRARRAMQRELLDEGILRPSLLLELANRELLALGLGKHVTMFCGVIDSGRRELRYSVAGHYPQPLVFDGKCAHYVEGRGMPAGLFDEAVYEDRMLALPAGFALVLFSDGLMELMGETTLVDKESRLLRVVGSGAVTVDALSREFALDGRRDIPDDVAMLVIRESSPGPA
ncbi:MAG: PP2C family protein-serine/threonine phosphatase [Pseudomonadota bacterium]